MNTLGSGLEVSAGVESGAATVGYGSGETLGAGITLAYGVGVPGAGVLSAGVPVAVAPGIMV